MSPARRTVSVLGAFLALLAVVAVLLFEQGGARGAGAPRSRLPAPASTMQEPAGDLAAAPEVVIAGESRTVSREPSSPSRSAKRRGGVRRTPMATLNVEVVSGDTGLPVLGVRVTVPDGGPRGRRSVGVGRGRDSGSNWTTGVDGHARLAVRAERAFFLRVRSGETLAGTTNVRVAALEAGEERELRLEVPTIMDERWAVRVVDGETLAPIVDAEVRAVRLEGTGLHRALEGDDALARARTDDDGRALVVLPTWAAVGVAVTADGYYPREIKLSAGRSEAEAPHDVELLRSASLTVAVHEGDRPVGAARVQVRINNHVLRSLEGRLGEMFAVFAPTDADGVASFPELPPRVPLDVLVRSGERVLERASVDDPERPPVTLEPGEQGTLDVDVAGACTVLGRAFGAEDEPLPDLRVLLLYSTSEEEGGLESYEPRKASLVRHAATQTDVRGGFVFEGVPPGSWSVAAVSRDLPEVATTFRIDEGQALARVELLVEALWIEGVLLGPDGEGRAGVTVEAQSLEGGHRVRAETGEGGRFQIGPLIRAKYRLMAWAKRRDEYAASHTEGVWAGERDVVLRIGLGGTLAGTVVDARGLPVEAEVSAGRGTSAWRDRGSTFSFRGLRPGTYALVARTEDGRIARLDGLAVEAGKTVGGLELRLAPGAWIELRVDERRTSGRWFHVARGDELLFRGRLEPGEERRALLEPGEVRVRWDAEDGAPPFHDVGVLIPERTLTFSF